MNNFFWQQHVMLLLLVFVAFFSLSLSPTCTTMSQYTNSQQTNKNWSEIYNRPTYCHFSLQIDVDIAIFPIQLKSYSIYFVCLKCSNDRAYRTRLHFKTTHSNERLGSHPSTCRLNRITISTTSIHFKVACNQSFPNQTIEAPLFNFHNVNFKWLSPCVVVVSIHR